MIAVLPAIAAGSVAYWVAVRALHVEEAEQISAFVTGRFRRRRAANGT